MTKQTQKNSIIRVAVDDGYAQVKACMHDGKGSIIESVIPTFVAPNDDGLLSLGMGKDQIQDGWYETENQRFVCGTGVNGEEVRFDNYHTSPWNRVAIHHALHTLGLSGHKVHLTVGLPIGDYYSRGKENSKLIELKKKSLKMPVKRLDDCEPIEIVDVEVSPQGISAYIDHVFGADGQIMNAPQGQIAIVDIGGRTLDVAVIKSNLSVDFQRSGTEDVGVLNVREELAEHICNVVNAKRLPLPAAEIAVRNGVVRLRGSDQDFTEARAQIIETVEKRLIFSIEKIVGETADIDVFLFVGGGARIFKSLAEHYEQGATAATPEMSNARGMLKRALAMATAA
ncbi:plasmid segregation actin-type ATPase ParM [Thalassospira xiamenensis M-5 = DSM 17429]|uniref:Plasmid segregation protein ParM/StbA domain-containing protein n=1 Tax=Thalassospira xiamenensis M-5 = DSM 17429 TaxID=1123366 RepID=A0AB72UJV2_9PROT|nr:ParM/StbA family protein [Thalassospira xiamenensis]AJD54402.1 hypothetical protein TH3_21648 [Thalassospira xiamenensis M-5 = DSM 17429]SIT21928.1 plasmid segregation actin-type ATPase ParM [Thalassospira xiamenensis M-5 = DSM 17429]